MDIIFMRIEGCFSIKNRSRGVVVVIRFILLLLLGFRFRV
jgi:hypothetical protein